MFLMILSVSLPSLLYGDGVYRIGKDKGGLYMETDQDGSWYIDPSHIDDFLPGETGRYDIKADHNGAFIKTARGSKYYINNEAREKWEHELHTFNEKQRQSKSIETKVVLLNGTQVLVPVTLQNRGRKMEVMMLLDTGASIMMLYQKIADQLALKSTRKARIIIADGSIIESQIVTLENVGVGPIQKEGIQASVIRHQRPDVAYQGLLGMNFLMGLDYRIDFDRKVIRWKPQPRYNVR
jgi:clan AA aspartic protease (TIGR02281 family)